MIESVGPKWRKVDAGLKLKFGWSRSLPMMLQTEATECGLACLAMVAHYYGHEVNLPGLRRRFPSSLKGASLAQIIDIAGQLSLGARALKLEPHDLQRLRTPCILHWDLGHFVVLRHARGAKITIHDPARGVHELDLREASAHFTGVALELTPKTDFSKVQAHQKISLRSLLGQVHGVAPALLQILGLATALEVFTLVVPFYLQWVLDHVLVSADRDLLALLGVGFLGVMLFKALVEVARSWAVTWLGANVAVQWQSNLVGHMLRLPLEWYEKRHVGDVVSRLDSARTIQKTLTTQFIGAVLDGVMSAGTLILMLFYSPLLASLVAGMFLVYGLTRWAFFSPIRRANENQISHAARQQTDLLEAIRGATSIKLANQQEQRRSRYANATVATTNSDVKVQILTISFNGLNQLLFGCGRIVLIWIAASRVLEGDFSAGMLVAFITYADQFTTRAAGLIDKWVDFRMLGLHAERLADVALAEPELHDQVAWDGEVQGASLELRNISFRYTQGEPWVLRGLNMKIESGESVAITGPSGSGKSTLAKIVLGLLEPTEGEVLFGGVPIKKLGVSRYRSMIGVVMQDDQLFAGSVADNIAFFDPHARPGMIGAAAKLAGIDKEVEQMPMGFQSLVGDMGSALSGGQRQRVILARALYRLPRLLVLDEATSHLDADCERLVSAAVSRLQLTRVVIAHRPETVASADREIHILNGKANLVGARRVLSGHAIKEVEVGC